MQNKESKFNWKLPLFGAVGFGVGIIIGGIIAYSLFKNFIVLNAMPSSIMGAIGGAALGLALKDKKKVLYLACAGAIGFAIGEAIGLTFKGAMPYSIIGAIGGAALGLALKDKKKVLYLACAGAIGFAVSHVINATVQFQIGYTTEFWEVIMVIITGILGYAIAGFTLGLTLAYLEKKEKVSNQ